MIRGGAGAAGVSTRTVEVNGQPCRVWEKGAGEPVGFLAGIGGLAGWTPFLDRLAERRRVVVPSVPGFPGAQGHDVLDSQLDWILATQDLLEAAGLAGADLIGVSVGAALAADVGACARGMVRRLVLVGPLGVYDEGGTDRGRLGPTPRRPAGDGLRGTGALPGGGRRPRG